MSSGVLETATSHVSVPDSALQVSAPLYDLVVKEILPDLGMEAESFWALMEEVIGEMAPKNNILLLKRYQIQAEINTWHQSRSDAPHDHDQYKKFLQKIGYLQPEGPDFQVSTEHVDDEIATIAGPQLVVPVKNARYALNATNSRWGSLYDALYGTDGIPLDDSPERSTGYDPARGAKVIAFARAFLDESFPLSAGSHADAVDYSVVDGALRVALADDTVSGLKDPEKFAGYNGRADAPAEILLCNNNLHAIIQIDPSHAIGKDDAASIKDIVIESAITTIQDCEDSVAAADGEDKAEVYRNWLGLMRGTLSETFMKGGKAVTRTLTPDLHFLNPKGAPITLHGRSLLLVRNVGHLMTNEAVLMHGQEVPEGILDAIITATIALYDLKRLNQLRNSRAGSMYIVKPKMHGPEEVEFACELFSQSRICARAAGQHLEDWHHGRRTPHHTQSESMYPRRHETAWSSSTPAFSIAPVMRSIPPWKRALWCAKTR